jgi:4a-hydroxytetrahydrobiopterin dehydratase
VANKLNDEAVQDRLSDIEGWTRDEGKLFRAFKFANFVEAIGFMTRAAIEAEKMDHHPEWFNVYSKVNVHLTTHSADGITELDFALAKKMDELAK